MSVPEPSRLGVALAALGAAGVGAALIPGNRPGLGVAITAVAVTGVVALALRQPTGERIVYLTLGTSLALPSALLSAAWVVAPGLIGAVALLALAATGGTDWERIRGALPRVVGRLASSQPFLLTSVVPALPPARRWGAVARGGLLALGGVVLFGGRFVSADRAFAQITRDVLVGWDLPLLGARLVTLGGLAALAGALVLATPAFAALTPEPVSLRARLGIHERERPLSFRPAEWTVPLVALNLLFGLFVAVQLTVLFGGHDHVLRTTELTYSEYARQGFSQLLAVAALTLGVIAGSARWAARETPAHDRLLRALLGLLCGFTLVVLASAMRRLGLYEEAFGFTRARLAVDLAILWLGGVFALIIAAGLTGRLRWLPVAVVIMTSASALSFALSNPDGRIAARGVERYESTGNIDLVYLSTLSSDAVPALLRLPEPLRSCALASVGDRVEGGDGLGSWNLSRSHAGSLLDARTLRGC